MLWVITHSFSMTQTEDRMYYTRELRSSKAQATSQHLNGPEPRSDWVRQIT